MNLEKQMTTYYTPVNERKDFEIKIKYYVDGRVGTKYRISLARWSKKKEKYITIEDGVNSCMFGTEKKAVEFCANFIEQNEWGELE